LIFAATSRNPDDRPRDGQAFANSLRNIQIKNNPAKQQMSLELDLPIATDVVKPSRAKVPPKESINDEATTEITREVTKPIDKPDRNSKKKGKGRLKWIAATLAVTLGIAGWWTLIGPGAKITVPSLVGGTVTQAESVLNPLGLKYDVAKEVFSEDIAKGIIIDSNPAGGDKVGDGATVNLTLSKGPERYQIPTDN
jgi:serine/threonine-protein kinase